ncbi:MAG TPA: DeoR family transcriptional regulator [Bacillota bacterium]|nr:DeoR family transcriptional regulator [Bacillota bacterium]
MLPVERQNRIMELVKERKNIKISELSTILSVSEMTVHRDLKALIAGGEIIKTFGGISLKESVQAHPKDDKCTYCHGSINDRLAYRIILANNDVEFTCCAHCGLLRHRQLREKATHAICHDFLKHTTINSSQATYVMDTSLNVGCCQPQVLAFELATDANKFVKGFGGTVYTFTEAIDVVYHKMNE